jgi:hypothetical protein
VWDITQGARGRIVVLVGDGDRDQHRLMATRHTQIWTISAQIRPRHSVLDIVTVINYDKYKVRKLKSVFEGLTYD